MKECEHAHTECLWFLQNHTICHTFISLYLIIMILFHILPLTSPLLASFSVPACTMSQQHAHTHIHALSSRNCCPFPPLFVKSHANSRSHTPDAAHARCTAVSQHFTSDGERRRRAGGRGMDEAD